MNGDETMSPEQAAAYLRVNLHTVYRNLRSGRLPGAKVGRQWRIRRRDLLHLLSGVSIAGEAVTSYGPASAVTRSQEEKRHIKLEEELQRILRIVKEQVHPERVILFGSVAHGGIGEWSDLDLVVVMRTDLPFYDRSKWILGLVKPKVGMDLLVYTPAEWSEMRERPFIRREILDRGRLLYEK